MGNAGHANVIQIFVDATRDIHLSGFCLGFLWQIVNVTLLLLMLADLDI